MNAMKKMGSPVRKPEMHKGQALADTSGEARGMALREKLLQLGTWLQTSFPQWGRTSLGNLVVVLNLKLRLTICTVHAVATPCLRSGLVACI